ncbi:hypothetical protein F4819DRAFT_473173 [Hypoxylon fuscum]|nr:hypothetical protein F4819DRAFT_473173 [Hypoxylon fuscum]
MIQNGNEANIPAAFLQLLFFSTSLLQRVCQHFGAQALTIVQEFNSRTQSFIKQDDHFAVCCLELDSHLNASGKRTLNENIADVGGISRAFATWRQRAPE